MVIEDAEYKQTVLHCNEDHER